MLSPDHVDSLKVILASEKQCDLLSSARIHDIADIRVKPDISLKDIIKRRSSQAELETHRQDGGENLR